MSRSSLFDASGSLFSPALDWVEALLFGPLALTLSVIGVALVGFAMLSGRLPLRLAGRTVMGIAIILSAPFIAAAFVSDDRGKVSTTSAPIEASQPPRVLPSADKDQNAGASLRRD